MAKEPVVFRTPLLGGCNRITYDPAANLLLAGGGAWLSLRVLDPQNHSTERALFGGCVASAATVVPAEPWVAVGLNGSPSLCPNGIVFLNQATLAVAWSVAFGYFPQLHADPARSEVYGLGGTPQSGGLVAVDYATQNVVGVVSSSQNPDIPAAYGTVQDLLVEGTGFGPGSIVRIELTHSTITRLGRLLWTDVPTGILALGTAVGAAIVLGGRPVRRARARPRDPSQGHRYP